MVVRSTACWLVLLGSSSRTWGFTTTTTTTKKSLHSLRVAAAAPLAASSSDDAAFDEVCDVLVVGSGPAARAIASVLSAKNDDDSNLNVIVADQNAPRPWPPNYGVWEDEWQAVVERYAQAGVPFAGGSAKNSIDRKWEQTDCYFGGSFGIPAEERMRLDRPYLRVDKEALRDSLTPGTYRIIEANHISEALATPNIFQPAGSLVHDKDGTTIRLRKKNEAILTVRTKLVIDCTGHESKLVLRDRRPDAPEPGFQIAYGCLVDVEESDPSSSTIGPYDKETMTLFDYRTDHFNDAERPKAEESPTFMYAMPLEGNQIFFEETSLVARPAVSFQECKDRCQTRLAHLGIRTKKLHEEEFCYIPMGGAIPAKDQRVIALGGSAAMVHASTGYHICRCLIGATDVGRVIREELLSSNNDDINVDRAAARAYHAIWTPENQRQRAFTVFGGEFLMKQNVEGLRGFFDGFFRLPLPLWAGFLAGWPGLPNNDKHETWYARMAYGVQFLSKIQFPVAVDMVLSIIMYMIKEGPPLIQAVTPLLGEPESFDYKAPNRDRLGDVAAKEEARRMLTEAAEVVPVAFVPDDADNDDNIGSTSTDASTVQAAKTDAVDDKESVLQ